MTTAVQRQLTDIASDAYRIFDEADLAGIDRLYGTELVDHNPVPGASNPLDGMRTLVGWIRDGFTNPHHEIIYQAVTGGDTVVTQWRMTGVHTGQFLGVAATNRNLSFTGTDIVRISDNQIVELRHVEDLFGAYMQMTNPTLSPAPRALG
jgi:predicted ester cyclase